MVKNIKITCEVVTDGSKTYGTQLNITGTGIFPVTDGKFKSKKFFLEFDDLCNFCTSMNLDVYLEQFDEKNSMRGFIRHAFLTHVDKNIKDGIKIFMHIDGDKTNVIGLHIVNDVVTFGKFGDESFLHDISDAIQASIDKNINESTKNHTPKNQRTVNYKIRYHNLYHETELQKDYTRWSEELI